MQAFNTTLQIVQNSSTLFNRCFCFFFRKVCKAFTNNSAQHLHHLTKLYKGVHNFTSNNFTSKHYKTSQNFTKLYTTTQHFKTFHKISQTLRQFTKQLHNFFLTKLYNNSTTLHTSSQQLHNNLQNFTTHCTTLQNSTQHSLQHFTTLYNTLHHCTQLCASKTCFNFFLRKLYKTLQYFTKLYKTL